MDKAGAVEVEAGEWGKVGTVGAVELGSWFVVNVVWVGFSHGLVFFRISASRLRLSKCSFFEWGRFASKSSHDFQMMRP